MIIAVETKSIQMYKDYEVRILQVRNVRVGGAVGGVVDNHGSSGQGGGVLESLSLFRKGVVIGLCHDCMRPTSSLPQCHLDPCCRTGLAPPALCSTSTTLAGLTLECPIAPLVCSPCCNT